MLLLVSLLFSRSRRRSLESVMNMDSDNNNEDNDNACFSLII